jgi:hypothetical protein
VKIILETKLPSDYRYGLSGARVLREGITLGSVTVLPFLIRNNLVFDITKFVKGKETSVPGHTQEAKASGSERRRGHHLNPATQPAELLELACEYANVKAVEALLDAGVPADCKLEESRLFDFPMEAALSSNGPGAEDVVRILLEKGAKPVDVSKIRSASLFERGRMPYTRKRLKVHLEHNCKVY